MSDPQLFFLAGAASLTVWGLLYATVKHCFDRHDEFIQR